MSFFLGLLFGALGTGYLVYGKRQNDALCLVIGAALILYPYFFENAIAIVVIGVGLALVPVAVARGWF